MKPSNRLLRSVPLLALPLLAFSSRADEVSFAPAEGAALSKELSLAATFYLDDISAVVDGQELPPQTMGDMMGQGLLFDAVIGVTDEYASSGNGKIERLLRTFDSLSLEAGPETGAESVDEFAELEDSTVVFEWDEEMGEYVKSFHESEGDEALLDNLDVDMDLIALLPRGGVSEGDTWEARGESLASVFLPGGMPASPDADEAEAEEMAELVKEELELQLEEAFDEFAVRCTYNGIREDGDVKVGVIDFEFSGEASIDLSDMIQSVIDMQGGGMDVEADIYATVDMEFDGTGTLLWNMAAGHVHHYEMDGDLILMADVEADIEAQGEAHTAEMSAEVSSEMNWVMTTESAGE